MVHALHGRQKTNVLVNVRLLWIVSPINRTMSKYSIQHTREEEQEAR